MVSYSSSLCSVNGGLLLQHSCRSSFSNNQLSTKVFRWGLGRDNNSAPTRGQTVHVLANTNVCIQGSYMHNANISGKCSKKPCGETNATAHVLQTLQITIASGKSKKEVIMVDPIEAKRLAAKQMEQIKAKQSFKRRRQIEAINGAWAMLGLTAGLVIEGQTGNSILAQLAGYWAALIGLFARLL